MARKFPPRGSGLATLGEVAASHRGAAEKETFSVALARIRKGEGNSHRDVAEHCRVPTARIRAWEEGTESPTRGEFRRLTFMLRRIEFYPPESYGEGHSVKETLQEKALELEEQGEMLFARHAAVAILDDMGDGILSDEPKSAALVVGDTGAMVASEKRLVEAKLDDAVDQWVAGRPGSEKRVTKMRQIARGFLEDAKTPLERQQRLEEIRRELPRAERRLMGIPSPDKAPPLRPGVRVATLTKKCPRCGAEVDDLLSHRERCAKWKPKPVREVSLNLAPSGDVAARKGNNAEALAVPFPATAEVVPAPPMAPDSETSLVGDRGLDLVERCLVLADLLWPYEAHKLVFWHAGGIWNATIEGQAGGSDVRGGGSAVTKDGAMRALADSLRGETKVRAKAAEDMARLLED